MSLHQTLPRHSRPAASTGSSGVGAERAQAFFTPSAFSGFL